VQERFDGENRASPCGASHLEQHQTDRAAPDHRDRTPESNMAEVKAMQCHSEWFEQSYCLVAEAFGHGIEQVGGPRQVLTQATVGRAVARKANLRAEVAESSAASFAGTARDRGVDSHPLSVQRPALDGPSELVAEHQRRGELGVADVPLTEPMKIGAAQPDRGDAHQALVRSWHGSRLFH
jgi:hypothetical protein